MRTIVKQVEIYPSETDLQTVWYKIKKSRIPFILIENVFLLKTLMDADIPSLAKSVACNTRRIVVQQGFEEASAQ